MVIIVWHPKSSGRVTNIGGMNKLYSIVENFIINLYKFIYICTHENVTDRELDRRIPLHEVQVTV